MSSKNVTTNKTGPRGCFKEFGVGIGKEDVLKNILGVEKIIYNINYYNNILSKI